MHEHDHETCPNGTIAIRIHVLHLITCTPRHGGGELHEHWNTLSLSLSLSFPWSTWHAWHQIVDGYFCVFVTTTAAATAAAARIVWRQKQLHPIWRIFCPPCEFSKLLSIRLLCCIVPTSLFLFFIIFYSGWVFIQAISIPLPSRFICKYHLKLLSIKLTGK